MFPSDPVRALRRTALSATLALAWGLPPTVSVLAAGAGLAWELLGLLALGLAIATTAALRDGGVLRTDRRARLAAALAMAVAAILLAATGPALASQLRHALPFLAVAGAALLGDRRALAAALTLALGLAAAPLLAAPAMPPAVAGGLLIGLAAALDRLRAVIGGRIPPARRVRRLGCRPGGAVFVAPRAPARVLVRAETTPDGGLRCALALAPGAPRAVHLRLTRR